MTRRGPLTAQLFHLHRWLPAALSLLILCGIAVLFCFEAASAITRLSGGSVTGGDAHSAIFSAPAAVSQDDAARQTAEGNIWERLERFASQQEGHSPRNPPLTLVVRTFPAVLPPLPWVAFNGCPDVGRLLPLGAIAFRSHPPRAPPLL